MQPHHSTPLAVRFWSKVHKSDDPDACWEWTGAHHPFGYGVIGIDSQKIATTHRVAWELAYGPIPNGLWVLHHCDNPACVRPEHLFLGTHADNMADMVAKGRWTPRPERARGERNGTHTHSEKVARGEACSWAKLTDTQVSEIRRRYAAGGITQRGLGREFGVSQVAIGKVVRRDIRKGI